MRLVVAVGSLGMLGLLAGACVGDNPEAGPPGNTSSGGGSSSGDTTSSGGGSSSGDTTSSGGGSSSSGGPSCPTDFGNCDDSADGTCETSLLTSAAHCGACGRACGGSATCTAGTCSAETLASQLAQPFALEVAGTRAAWIERPSLRGCLLGGCSPVILHDLASASANANAFEPFYSASQLAVVDNEIYFSRCLGAATLPQDCGVARCALTGCKDAPTPHLSPTPVSDRRARVLIAGPGAIYTFSQMNGGALQRTDLASGAMGPFPADLEEHFQDMYADTQDFLYVDNNPSLANPTGGLYRCPPSGCTSGVARTRLLPPPVRNLAVANRVAFVSEGSRENARILSCNIDNCAGTETVLAQNQPYVTAIAADATEVYWINVGADDPQTNAAAVGSLMRCTLPECAGGPVTVAQNLVNPVSVRLDANYVYWMTYGSPTQATGTLVRQRR